MSDALRTYEFRHRPRRRRRRRPRRGWLFVPLVLLALAGCALWMTRDTHPVARLTPRAQGLRVVAGDVLAKRGKVAGSTVWRGLPASLGLDVVPTRLNQDLGLPQWVLNNLIGPVCHLSGNDLAEFDDVLLVTRMSRIGCLVEKLHWLAPSVERDHAGGLNLRYLASARLYYAVRGRALAVSPSREALIRALTLRAEEACDPNVLADGAQAFGAEDLRGAVTFGEAAPGEPDASALGRLGRVFSSLRFAVRVDPVEAEVRCRGTLRPEWADRLEGLLADASPRELGLPPPGLVMVSADFGKPAREVWDGVLGLFEYPTAWSGRWDNWAAPAAGADSPGAALGRFVTHVVGPAGPGIRLSWCGMDLNEMAPMPLVAGTFDATFGGIGALLGALPPPPDDASWVSASRTSSE